MNRSSSNDPLLLHPWAWMDHLGIGLAVICAVHCLVTPVLVIFLPLLASTFWSDHTFHLWMLALVLPLTGFSVFLGCRKHRDRWVLLFSVSGIALLLVGVLFGFNSLPISQVPGHHGHLHHSILPLFVFPHGWESLFTTCGGISLIFSHVRNYRLCRHCRCRHHD